MKRNTILLLLAAALMTAVSCGKDNEKPEQPAPGGTADGWPVKKISRIVHNEALHTGVYIVKVGDRPARKVVVIE